MNGNLVVKSQPLIPRVLSVSEGALVARRPLKPPCSNGFKDNDELTHRLSSQKRFVPWGSTKPVLAAINTNINIPTDTYVVTRDTNENLPPGVEPLVLWQSDELDEKGDCMFQIEVDPLLVQYLRPHQREGVQFMFDCVSGVSSSDGISGCILADDMGSY